MVGIMHSMLLLSAYLSVASFCYLVSSKEELKLKYGHVTIWTTFGVLILALGWCRFCEIQTLLTVLARSAIGDAYEFHREIQAFILGSIVLFGCAISAVCLYLLRKRLDYLIGFVGVTSLISLFLMRSLSYHYIDLMLSSKLGILSVANVYEMTGLMLMVVASQVVPRSKPQLTIVNSCTGQPVGWPTY